MIGARIKSLYGQTSPDSVIEERLERLAIFNVLPAISCHVFKQMFDKVKIVSYRKIFGALPIEDRSNSSRSNINKVIERRHVHVCQDEWEFCKTNVLLSNFRDASCDLTFQVFVMRTKVMNCRLYARKRSIEGNPVGGNLRFVS